jgi:hypothetical protein
MLNRVSEHVTDEHDDKRQDLTLIGNQLYAIYDTKPGGILTINPNITENLVQDKISLVLSAENAGNGFRRLITKKSITALSSNPQASLNCFATLTLYGDESIIQHIKFKQGIEKDLNHALKTLSTTR